MASAAAREAGRDELVDLLRRLFAQRPTAEWLEIFAGSGVGLVEPADSSISHAFLNDPEQRRLGRVAETAHPTKGGVREFDRLVRVSDTDNAPHRLAPELGAHNDEILSVLGFATDEIATLRAHGAIR